MSELAASGRFAHRSEVRGAFLGEGGDAFAVLGGAHRLVEEAERVGDRGGGVVAQEVGGDLALGRGDGVRAGGRSE